MLGIFAIAVYRLGRAAIKDAGPLAFAVASAMAMAFPQVGIVTVMLVAGSIAIMLYASRAWGAVLVAATLALAPLLALTRVRGSTSTNSSRLCATQRERTTLRAEISAGWGR